MRPTAYWRPGTWLRLAAAAAVIALGAFPAIGHAATISTPSKLAKLSGCWLTPTWTHDDVARIDGYVPDAFQVYEFPAGFPPLYAGGDTSKPWTFSGEWHLSCDAVTVGSDTRPTELTLFSVAIHKPAEPESIGSPPIPMFANYGDFYLVAGRTNNRGLANALSADGFPVTWVDDIRYSRDPDVNPSVKYQARTATILAPPAKAGYWMTASIPAGAESDPPHEHNNSLWHQTSSGKIVELEMDLCRLLLQCTMTDTAGPATRATKRQAPMAPFMCGEGLCTEEQDADGAVWLRRPALVLDHDQHTFGDLVVRKH